MIARASDEAPADALIIRKPVRAIHALPGREVTDRHRGVINRERLGLDTHANKGRTNQASARGWGGAGSLGTWLSFIFSLLSVLFPPAHHPPNDPSSDFGYTTDVYRGKPNMGWWWCHSHSRFSSQVARKMV